MLLGVIREIKISSDWFGLVFPALEIAVKGIEIAFKLEIAIRLFQCIHFNDKSNLQYRDNLEHCKKRTGPLLPLPTLSLCNPGKSTMNLRSNQKAIIKTWPEVGAF